MKNSKRKPKRQKPPSRIKYEAANPTISFRINQQLYERLQHLLAVTGKSTGDFIREALKVQNISAGKAFNSGYDDGYQHGGHWGYQEASKLYRIAYPCPKCGKPIEITADDEKESVREHMKQAGWHHVKCPKK